MEARCSELSGALRLPLPHQAIPKAIVRDIENLLVRIHFVLEIIWWTGLAPWEFEFRFSGSLTSTFLGHRYTTTCFDATLVQTTTIVVSNRF